MQYIDTNPYKVYSWPEVARMCDKLFKEIINPRIDSATKEVYNNNLPQIMSRIFMEAYLMDLDRSRIEIQILLNAQRQLADKGFIGYGT